MADNPEPVTEPLPPSADHKSNEALNLLCENYSSVDVDKCHNIRSIIERDLVAADLKFSLFAAACNSYRHDFVVRPFPPQYMHSNGIRDIDELRSVITKIPPFDRVLEELRAGSLDGRCIDLLSWVLETGPKLSVVPNNIVDTVPQPSYIVDVTWAPSSSSEARWQSLREGHETFFAFHGSRFDNFHSILHHGLQQHMNKNSLFGKGVYLASELGISLLYSSGGLTWENSCIGDQLSCVALCELIDHPDVKCRTKDDDNEERATPKDSEAGALPEKYFVVVNNELVRVRQILVYSSGKKNKSLRSSAMSWWSRHRFLLLMIAYVVVLFAVGLGNSQTFSRNVQRWLRRFQISQD